MNEEDAPPRSRAASRRILQAATFAAMALVSYGSHEVLVWIGVPNWPAWIYPGVVDLAVLYVTPFAADVTRPEPLRRHAARTRAMVWCCVAAFNILHAVLLVQHGLIPGGMRVVAYAVAVIAGGAPVLFYGRAFHLEKLDANWERQERIVAVRDEQAEAKAEQQREKARRERHEDEDRAHRMKMDLMRVSREEERESRRESRRPSARVPARDRDTDPDDGIGNAQVSDGKTKAQLAEEWFLAEWEAGRDPSGAECARAIPCDPKIGSEAKRVLLARGLGPGKTTPEQRRLTAVGN